MRDIKFRLRSNNRIIVGYCKWYEGTLNKGTNLYTADPCWLYSEDGNYWSPEKIFHRYKDQWTGLKDKNRKLIYEGDLLSHKFYSTPVVVSFDHAAFIAEDVSIFDNSLEVVGNLSLPLKIINEKINNQSKTI